ncbi:MAG: NUDIX domain-containing protein [Bacteroidota bacterium]|nr:NUDIX domain-containing protein [Bacteroidota bacterium]MDX5404905.1 NUDIX domain-containing protein [Bacteroidota bacterium]MDX5428478.1 NUDIX domain-containing protein [Bacteroidota bacterium]MDX5447965.1 NUDIX domain-containing protein [Bacteroidota bacterium]MDX5506233.1 NUDIX domain-containing protein [Bacteroidota bacterium]
MMEVCCAIIIQGDFVLLAQRLPGADQELMWEFPGGKVEDGESLTIALKREIKEELDAEIEINGQIPPTFHQYPEKTIRLWPFICSLQSEYHPRDVHSLRWWPIGPKAPEELAPADIEVWNDFIKWYYENPPAKG